MSSPAAPSPPGSRVERWLATTRPLVGYHLPALVAFMSLLPGASVGEAIGYAFLAFVMQAVLFIAYAFAVMAVHAVAGEPHDVERLVKFDARAIGALLLTVAMWAWLQSARATERQTLEACMTRQIPTLSGRGNDAILDVFYECVSESRHSDDDVRSD